MSDFLEEMKRRWAEDFADSLQPVAENCPFTKEQVIRAYKQAVGVMYAYKDARAQKGIDVHHLPRWEEALRHAARSLCHEGAEGFLIDYERSLSCDNEERLKAYPLLKGLETMGKLLKSSRTSSSRKH